MALIGIDGRWLQVNAALSRITGLNEAALRATTLQELTHPEDVDLDAENVRQLVAGVIESFQIEKRFRHAWGHYVWVQVTTCIVHDGRRKPLFSSFRFRISPSGRSWGGISSTSSTTTSLRACSIAATSRRS